MGLMDRMNELNDEAQVEGQDDIPATEAEAADATAAPDTPSSAADPGVDDPFDTPDTGQEPHDEPAAEPSGAETGAPRPDQGPLASPNTISDPDLALRLQPGQALRMRIPTADAREGELMNVEMIISHVADGRVHFWSQDEQGPNTDFAPSIGAVAAAVDLRDRHEAGQPDPRPNPETPVETRSGGDETTAPWPTPAAPPMHVDEDQRAATMAATGCDGSVVQGPSAEEMTREHTPVDGDATPEEAQRRVAERMEMQSIPRPSGWPDFMRFPPKRYEDLLKSPDFGEKQREMLVDKMFKDVEHMQRRARQINDWILDEGDPELTGPMRKARKKQRKTFFRAEQERARNEARGTGQDAREVDDGRIVDERDYINDPLYGVRFAALLDTDQNSFANKEGNMIAAWAHDRFRTFDGGMVQAKGDELVIPRTMNPLKKTNATAQAAHAMVMEAKERGWETIEVEGNDDFCRHIKQAAQQSGMGAKITSRMNLGLRRHTEVVMPNPPLYYKDSEKEKGAEPPEQPSADPDAAAAANQLDRPREDDAGTPGMQ